MKTLKKNYFYGSLFLGWLLMISFFSQNVFSFGSKRKKTHTAPAFTQASPIRPVFLKPIGTRAFKLPNGVSVHLQADLQAMLQTQVTQSHKLAPSFYTIPRYPDKKSCKSHIELHASLSALELKIAGASITIGYNPSKIHIPLTHIDGKAEINIGTISMDFALFECQNDFCSAVSASHVDQLTSDIKLSFDADFTLIQSSAEFFWNTALSKVLRKMMKQGIKKLIQSQSFHNLPWFSKIVKTYTNQGKILIPVGTKEGLNIQNQFEILKSIDTRNTCPVYETLALGHVNRVFRTSSEILFDVFYQSRPVQIGDMVTIHKLLK